MTERNDIDSLDFRLFQTQHTLNDANAALVEAEATIRELTAERDEARRQLNEARHTIVDVCSLLGEEQCDFPRLLVLKTLSDRDAARRLYCQTLWEYQNFRRTRKHAAPEAIAVAHNWDCYE